MLGAAQTGLYQTGPVYPSEATVTICVVFLGVLPPSCKSGVWEQPRLIRPRYYSSDEWAGEEEEGGDGMTGTTPASDGCVNLGRALHALDSNARSATFSQSCSCENTCLVTNAGGAMP